MIRTITLDLRRLNEDIPLLTANLAGAMSEAIVYCLQHHGHDSGVQCSIEGLNSILAEARIIWGIPASDRYRRAFGATRGAVERAAEGIAFLAILAMTDYTIIERTIIGDRFDFWLGFRAAATESILQREA